MTRQQRKFARKQGKVYGDFGREQCPLFDFSDDALIEFYYSESNGTPCHERNGYALGKSMAGIAVDQWERDIKNGLIHMSEIEEDFAGEHDWFIADIRGRVAKFEERRFRERKSFSWGLIVEKTRVHW